MVFLLAGLALILLCGLAAAWSASEVRWASHLDHEDAIAEAFRKASRKAAVDAAEMLDGPQTDGDFGPVVTGTVDEHPVISDCEHEWVQVGRTSLLTNGEAWRSQCSRCGAESAQWTQNAIPFEPHMTRLYNRPYVPRGADESGRSMLSSIKIR